MMPGFPLMEMRPNECSARQRRLRPPDGKVVRFMEIVTVARRSVTANLLWAI